MTDLHNGTVLYILLVGDERLDIIQMSFRHKKCKKYRRTSLVSAEFFF